MVLEEIPELRLPSFAESVDQALKILDPMTVQVCNQRAENRMRDISKHDFIRRSNHALQTVNKLQ